MGGGIAIVGSADLFGGFQALGVDVVDPLDQNMPVDECLETLPPDQYAIVFIAESYARGILAIIAARNSRTSQSVIIIPSLQAREGIAGEQIRRLVRKAVGADIA